MNKDLISIIIIALDKKRLLLETIYALLNQSIDNNLYEIIVVDNNSTNEIQQYLKENGVILKINYIYQGFINYAKAKNTAIKNTKGSIIIFLKDNILPSNRFIEYHLKYQKHFSDAAVIGFCEFKNSDTSMKKNKFIYKLNYDKISNNEDAGFSFFNTDNLSIKKEIISSIGGFDENFKYPGLEDIDMGYRLENEKKIKIMFFKEAYALKYLDKHDFQNLSWEEYQKGISLNYLYKKFPKEKFNDIDNYFNTKIMIPFPSLRKKIDKIILKILDNTIPIPFLMNYFYSDALKCSRIQGFIDADKKKNVTK